MNKMTVFILLVVLFIFSCDTAGNNGEDEMIEIQFANEEDSEYSISGFWLISDSGQEDQSLIPDGKTLDPGLFFVFYVPNTRHLHNYRVGVEHNSESLMLDNGPHGHALSISTEIGNPRYAHVRISHDPPRVTLVGCSSIGLGSNYDKEYELAEWASGN